MKEYIEVLLQRGRTAEEKSLLLREYLQSRILEFLQRQGVFESWAFLGGTALRFLYQLPRFSEKYKCLYFSENTNLNKIQTYAKNC